MATLLLVAITATFVLSISLPPAYLPAFLTRNSPAPPHPILCSTSKSSHLSNSLTVTRTSLSTLATPWHTTPFRPGAALPACPRPPASSWFSFSSLFPSSAPPSLAFNHTPHHHTHSNSPYQSILGFGGAFTESSSLLFSSLSSAGQDSVLDLLFAATGLGYNLGRTHINSCDFSVASYEFVPTENDFALTNFDTSVHHDTLSMIPFMKRATATLLTGWNDDLRIIASPWSPPAWLKTAVHGVRSMLSSAPMCLKSDRAAATWALYISKFITAYSLHDLNVFAVTVQNEPEFAAPWEACQFTKETEKSFVEDHLGPTLRRDHPDTRILGFDHNKDHAPKWAEHLLPSDNVDGIGYHWYAGGLDRLLDGAQGTPNLHKLAKITTSHDALLLQTEGCHCPSTGYAGGELSVNWERGERYAHAMLADLAAGSAGWIEWNLILDKTGGPNHLGNVCDAPLISIDAPVLGPHHENITIHGDSYSLEQLQELGGQIVHLQNGVMTQALYWVMGHFTRFLRPGSSPVAALLEPRRALSGATPNTLAREGIEITAWPCEGGKRQAFVWDTVEREVKMQVQDKNLSYEWVCVSKDNHVDFGGLTLTQCGGHLSGKFDLKDGRIMRNDRCLRIAELENNGGSVGSRGGSPIQLGACQGDDLERFEYSVVSGEIYSTPHDTCWTSGWPFLQGGVFKTSPASKGRGEGMGRGHTGSAGGGEFVMIVLNESNEGVELEILKDILLYLQPRSVVSTSFST